VADEPAIEWTEWWLPGKPEARVHGALTFDSTNGARVLLADALPGVRAVGRFPASTLHGEAPGRKALTLVAPMVISEQREHTQTRAWSHATIEAPTLLRGAHVDDPDTLTFDHGIVRFGGLREVCLAEWPQNEESPGGTFEPYVKPGISGVRCVEIEGGRLMFRHHADTENDDFKESSEKQVEAVLSPGKRVTLDEFEQGWLLPLGSLILLAAGGPAPLQRFTMVQVSESGAETPIEVLTRTPTLGPEPPEKYERPLLPFAALKDGDQEFFAAWWKLYADLGLAADFLNAVLEGEMFLELKLTTRMSFVESYHRAIHGQPVVLPAQHRKNVKAMVQVVNKSDRAHYRAGLAHAGEQHTRERVSELVAQAAQTLPEVTALNDDLTDSLVKTRNAFVHLDAKSAEPLDGIDLVYGVAWLRTILQITLLLDLGIPQRKVGGLVLTSYDGGRRMPLTDYRGDEA
jgi:hypothetical protein